MNADSTMRGLSFDTRVRFVMRACSIILFTLISLARYDITDAAQKTLPFEPGEKFVYKAKWHLIPAGEATMEILPFQTINNEKAYHFVMQLRTNAKIDLFYRIRDREDSFVDVNMTHSLRYQKREISKHPRNIVVTYDWGNKTVTRTNFGETSEPITIVPGTFDPVALFFVIRTKKLKEGEVLEIPITDGKTFFVAKASVTGREKITVGKKTYDTYVVIPDVERLEEALKRKEKAKLKIWFTADDKKVPVKIENEVGIGRFTFELISMAP